jgi:hydroxyacylglutathione hydrolase
LNQIEPKNGNKIIQILSGRSNVFLITNGEKNILIDTSAKNMWTRLERKLADLHINHIDYLILTHSHFDHAANAKKIKEKYNALVIVHKTEASYLKSGQNIIPNGTNLFTRIIVRLFAKKVLGKRNYESCQPDILIDSSFDLMELGFNGCVIHTPGHTVGSLSVIVNDEVALVGDLMFGIFRWSVFPPYATDIYKMINSWGRLLETNCSLFIPSHGSANSRNLVQKDYNKRFKSQL